MAWVAHAASFACMAGAVACAAKAHGRQVRLRREAEGVHAVQFGRDNGPFVHGLWRRDRLVFWPTLAVLLAASGGLAWLAGAWWLVAVQLLLAAWVLAFLLTAAFWAVALAAARKPVGHAAWIGSAAWLALTLALAAAGILAALLD